MRDVREFRLGHYPKCPTFPKIANFCKLFFRATLLFGSLKNFYAKSFKSDSCDTQGLKKYQIFSMS